MTIKLSKRVLSTATAFFIGTLNGFLWLLPVFGAPSVANFESIDSLSVERIIRVAAPLLVFLLVRYRSKIRLSPLLVISLFTLGIYPFFSGVIRGDIAFLLSSSMPLIVSVFVLIGIILMDVRTLRAWLLGIGLSAMFFILAGVTQGGLTPSTFFGERERVLLGFVHPAQTAAALLGAFLLVPLATWKEHNIRTRHRDQIVRMIVLSLFLWLLWLSQSRNTFLALFLGIFFYVLSQRLKPIYRFAAFILLIFAVLSIYVFSLLGDTQSSVWSSLDNLSSGRLLLYQDAIKNLLNQDVFTILVSPDRYARPILLALDMSTYRGFSAIDSVFLSFLLNFGLIGAMMLMWLLLAIALRLSTYPGKPLAYACLCTAVVFFTLDGAGITVSHLSMFVVFSYAVREAVLMTALVPRSIYEESPLHIPNSQIRHQIQQ